MVDRTKRMARRRGAGQKKLSKKDGQIGGSVPRSTVTHLWQSYTVNTPPRLIQNFGKTSAGIMNVTPRERKMITLQRRRGSEQEEVGESEKKNYFDGLRPSRDNLVTFFGQDSNSFQIPRNSDDSLSSSIFLCQPGRALAATTAPALIPNDTARRN